MIRTLARLCVVFYPLYLVHCSIANLSVTVAARFGQPASLAVALSIPVSMALAAVLHHGLERPAISAFRRASFLRVARPEDAFPLENTAPQLYVG